MKRFYIFSFFLLVSNVLMAQDIIITDRPDQTESATALQPKYFQIETGGALEVEGDFQNLVINTNLFRYGVAKNLELRLVTELSQQKINRIGYKAIGINDLELGFKYQFINKAVELALLSHLILPTGNENVSAREVGVSNKICFSHDVLENMSFGYNFGYDYYTKDNHAFTYTYAVGVGLTEKIGFYSEIYGGLAEFENFSISYDGGFTLLLQPNLQLDFSVGTGINNRANYYAIGASWRLPN